MGCASSKQKRCKHCHNAYSPERRSVSMHVVHPPLQKGDSYHVVALTSTTLGSLALDSLNKENGVVDDGFVVKGNESKDVNGGGFNANQNGFSNDLRSKEVAVNLIEARTWSQLIQSKIPKVVPRTPTMTPPGEPETINAWELMAGLEDVSPLHIPTGHIRSFSFDVSPNQNVSVDSPKMTRLQPQRDDQSLPPHVDKTIWCQTANEDTHSKNVEFDPEVIDSFRKSLEELSPEHWLYLKPSDGDQKEPSSASDHLSIEGENDDTSNRCALVKDIEMNDDDDDTSNAYTGVKDCIAKDKVVVYFTSLRGVRKTYEDSCHVRVILKGVGVRVDERDVSMHSVFKEELRGLLGQGFKGGLPKVFIGKRYIGGAEEIRQLNEEGKLEKMVEGCEMVDDGAEGYMRACDACGDIRFVPCETCSGSCKIYYEFEDEEHEELVENEESTEFGFRRCPDCNENGLIRCPICCD